MATVVAQASGNFSAGATWVGGVKPQPDDTAQTANYTVTVDENFTGTLNPTGSGHFEITTGGITITGDLVMQSTYTSGGLRCTHATGVVALSGTVTGGSGSSASGAYNASTGTLIVGTATGGSGGNAYGTNNASTGTLTVGTVTGGSGSSAFGAYNASPGTLTVGTVTGGSGSSAFGAYNANAGTMTVGTATGGSGGSAFGAYNGSNGTARIGTAIGNNFGPGGGTNSVPGVYGSGSPGAITTVKHAVHGAYGQAPLAGSVLLLDDAGDNTYTYREVLNGATQVLNHPSLTPDWPAESDVRNGTPYGSGTRTGSAYIPAAASVAYGVPVDATTGTAVLTAAAATAAVWDAARSGHADAGTFGATSEWAGSVDEEAIATAVLDALGSAGNLDSQLASLPTAAENAAEVDSVLSAAHGNGSWGSGASGSGAIEYTVTVNDESAQPLDGVEVWVTSDSAGTTVVAGTLTTNAAGQVAFMLDAGTYYVWRQLARYNFANPITITVA
jgi:hypothetical protein